MHIYRDKLLLRKFIKFNSSAQKGKWNSKCVIVRHYVSSQWYKFYIRNQSTLLHQEVLEIVYDACFPLNTYIYMQCPSGLITPLIIKPRDPSCAQFSIL
jgi:hypothetical protein